MKKIALIVFLFVAFYGKAQKTEILDRSWILDKVIISNVEHILPTDSFKTGETSFTSNEFNSKICNNYISKVSYQNEDTIIFGDGTLTLIQCNPITEDHYNKFENYYFSDFFRENFNNKSIIYTYKIDENNNGYQLTITNTKGDKAIYFSEKLNIKDMTVTKIVVSPNPVKNILYIKSTSDYKKLSVEIYDMQGRLIVNHILNDKKEVNVSNLVKGTYIIKIKDFDKLILQSKIIKN